MAEYRTHMKIIGDILTTAQNDLQDEDGSSVTYLIKKANVSHPRLSRMLKMLISHGLMEQVGSKGASRYRISQSGREFLREYYVFMTFAESFGLNI